ncbi:hypothetical protein QE152_g21968 [Popillia japonica]|uniref:Uncharacterized protein n=1 Tax=Popillia japonica TaxID=7064 RepID=A0AAW1KLT7_POPJA
MGQNYKQDRGSNVSFEDLLLKTVKQNATSSSSTKKRRVATGAEVIKHQKLEHLPMPENKAPSGKAIKKQKRKNRNRDSASSESSITPLYEESDNFLDFLSEDVFVTAAAEKLENFNLHAWLLVKYFTKKIIKYYTDQITEMYKPETEDVDTIIYENIEMFLPNPIEDRRGNLFTFGVEFSGLNIC